jgi:ATP-binding cassette, subfamily B, bacterial
MGSDDKFLRRSNINIQRLVLFASQIERAVRLVWESSSTWMLASIVLIFFQGLLPLISLYLIKVIVDLIAPNSTAQTNGDFSQVIFFVSLACAVALLAALCRSANAVVSEAQTAMISDHVQDLLHAKSIEIDLEYYETPVYYDALHRAQREAPFRPSRIVNGLAQIAQSSLSLIGIMIILISLSWTIALVLVAAAIPGIIIRLKYAEKLYEWQRDATSRERMAWYLHWLVTSDSHAKEVRLFDLGSLLTGRYRDLRLQLREERLNITIKRSTADLVAQAGSILALFGALAYIAYQTLLGTLTVGDMVMYFGAFQQGQSFLQTTMAGITGLYEDSLFLTSLFEFLALKPHVKEPLHPVAFPRPMQKGIRFENAGFRYPGCKETVLEDVNLEINCGQTVALVGENGSGKTTLVKLICRLYDPIGGRITIDDHDLRNFSIADLRKEICIIFQDYVHYNLTVRENIWVGNIDCPTGSDRVVQAAKLSGADGFISGLGQGYDTVLGKWFEDGAELSTGEWQKIALARAFMRDAQIIILDEPTSALDAKAEEEVFQRFKELAKGRTAIIISHRLSTVKMADYIYFLKDGRIAERGTHRELVEKGGRYAEMFEIQARHYR